MQLSKAENVVDRSYTGPFDWQYIEPKKNRGAHFLSTRYSSRHFLRHFEARAQLLTGSD